MGNEGAIPRATKSTIVSIACVIVETVERLNYKKIQFAIPFI